MIRRFKSQIGFQQSRVLFHVGSELVSTHSHMTDNTLYDTHCKVKTCFQNASWSSFTCF